MTAYRTEKMTSIETYMFGLKSRAHLHIKASLDLAEQNGFPSWVEVDAKNFKGVFKALPDRGEFANDVNEQLVVELYSK